MLILICGQDTYRSLSRLNETVEDYKKNQKNNLGLKHFDFQREEYGDFMKEFQSISMFIGTRLMVLRNTFSNEIFKAEFLKNQESFLNLKDIILFLEEDKISLGDKLLKFLQKNGKVQEFNLLEGEELKNWAQKEFLSYRAEISSRAIEKLISNTGNDLWQLNNEIKKLVSYKKGGTIEVEDIGLMGHSKIEADIFKTIDAIADKNKSKALSLIHKHIEKGDSPLYLFSMINFQFRNLLLMKTQGYGRVNPKLGIHPFVARKALGQSQKFTIGELKIIYNKIFQFDLSIKTGKIDVQSALDLFIAEI